MPLGLGRVAMGGSFAVGLYALSQWLMPQGGGAAILSKLLFLAAFPVVAWKSGMLAPSAADTVTSACAATVDAIGRTYRGWSRRAFNQ